MITSIVVGVAVLAVSWMGAKAARLAGFEDPVFVLSMFGFMLFGAIVVAFPLLGYSVQSSIYVVLLCGTILFGFMSAWMGQE